MTILGRQMARGWLLAMALGCFLLAGRTLAEGNDPPVADFPGLCADRAAVERVYYRHRIGEKEAFEQALPPARIEELVRDDLKKAAVLQHVYGAEITPAMVTVEVQRIVATTRAPETLAEIEAALGHDAMRFARTVARPIVVARMLREKFENDDSLHAVQRGAAADVRNRLLAGKEHGIEAQLAALRECRGGEVQELVRWELAVPPNDAPKNASSTAPTVPTSDTASSSDYRIESKLQKAQVLSSPDQAGGGHERKSYFEDLPPDLQKVLRAQLHHPGDVSAVIETPRGFLVYLERESTPRTLGVAMLSVPKRSYEDWLAQQPEPTLPSH